MFLPVVSLRDLSVRTPLGRTLLTVPDLALAAGDRVVVTGPSGAGKSLLLALLAGRRLPGLVVDGVREGAAVCAVVPQRGLDALHPLVGLERQLRRVTGADAERTIDVLARLGLGEPDLRRRRPARLSGGQAQRGAIALAVLGGAPLVVADELTSALDHRTRDETLALLDYLLDPDRALVVATHDLTVAEAVGARTDGRAGRRRHLRVDAGRLSEDVA